MNYFLYRLIITSDFLLYQKLKKYVFFRIFFAKQNLIHIISVSYECALSFVLEASSELGTRLISAMFLSVVLKQKVQNRKMICMRSCGKFDLDLLGNERFLLLSSTHLFIRL